MDRRSFLQWQMKGLILLGVGGMAPPLLSRPALADGTPEIAVVKGGPAAAARRAVDLLGGMGRFVKPGDKVVIKPNMSFARGPEFGTNTHPEVVRELLIMCKEAGAGRIRVLDHSLHDAEQSLKQSGILDACNSVEQGICHHLMHRRMYVEVPFAEALEMKENMVMRDVREADVFIAAPVAKSHGSTGVSLSLKGQMGVVLERRIMHSRYDLDTAIVDLNSAVRPDLVVIDATRVLTTNGPGGPGKIITPGEVIASADAVAADATAVSRYEWYGRKMEPRQVGHIAKAHARGLGNMHIAQMKTQYLEV